MVRLRLPVRPTIEVGEGPLGYRCRLARANLLSTRTLEELGIDPASAVLGSAAGDQILADSTSATATSQSYVEAVVHALRGSPAIWVYRHGRFCPMCLSVRSIWQLGWEILYADACPVHAVWLIDRCRQCGRTLSWDRPMLDRCGCGAKLAGEIPASSPPAVAKLAGMLVGKVWGGDLHGMPEWLGGLALDHAQRLVRFLGAYADPSPMPRAQKIFDASAMEVSWRYSSLAAEVLLRWPDGFREVLCGFTDLKAASRDHRLGHRFGQFYRYLYRGLPETVFDPLRKEFEEFVIDNWRAPLARRNRRLSEGALERAGWISIGVASAMLDLSKRRLHDLLAEGRLVGESRTGRDGRRLIIISRKSIEAYRDDVGIEVDLNTARGTLGISRPRARRMIPRLVGGASKASERGGSWAIPSEKLRVMQDIADALPQVAAVGVGQVMVGHVLRFHRWSDDLLADFVEAVARKRLKPVARLSSGGCLVGMIFAVADLKLWRNATKPAGDPISIPEAATWLSVKQEVAYALVRGGLLATLSAEPPLGARVGIAELARFSNSYVSARQLANEHGTSPRAVIAALRAEGVLPLTGPDVDGCRQVFFVREQLLYTVLNAGRERRSDQR